MEDRSEIVPKPDDPLKKLEESVTRDLQPEAHPEVSNEDWVAISEWLNIPLTEDRGPMAGQIMEFFRANVVASGVESLKWLGEDFKFQIRPVSTADLRAPSPNLYDTTHGWYVFYGESERLSELTVIAEREQGGRGQSNSIIIEFSKTESDKDFKPQVARSTHPAYNTKYIIPRIMPPDGDSLGWRVSEKERKGMNVQLFHVRNQRPQLPDTSRKT